jgi:hypothetical protein
MSNEKTIDVNIKSVLADNRQAASLIGALIGKAYAKVESRDCWQGGKEGFENDKAKATAPGAAGLILNRSPRKFMLKIHDILGAQMYVQPLTKQVGVVVNLDNSNGSYDMFFPLDGSNPTVAEKPMAEAISDALKGEGQNFFLEPSKVVAVVNEGNRAEVKNIDTLIAALNKMKQNIITTINENEKKAIEIDKEWATSKVNGVDIKDVVASASSAVINVHTATEE